MSLRGLVAYFDATLEPVELDAGGRRSLREDRGELCEDLLVPVGLRVVAELADA